MIKVIIGMVLSAVILFMVFAIIGAYREVSANATKIKELKKKCDYEYERGYLAGFTSAEKNMRERRETE